jgi:hypothetical protein
LAKALPRIAVIGTATHQRQDQDLCVWGLKAEPDKDAGSLISALGAANPKKAGVYKTPLSQLY